MIASFKNILIVLAIILVSILLLHAIIPHDHPKEIFGTGIQAALHGQDKKWWALLLLASFLFAFASFLRNRLTLGLNHFVHQSRYLIFDFSKIFDPIREALRSGILQPKLCD